MISRKGRKEAECFLADSNMLRAVLKIVISYSEITLFYKKRSDNAGKSGLKSKKNSSDNK